MAFTLLLQSSNMQCQKGGGHPESVEVHGKLELLGLHSSLLHLSLDVPLIRWSWSKSAAKVLELIGAMDMKAVVVTKAHCLRNELLCGES